MGIFILITAILLFVSIFLAFRIFDIYKIDNSQALIINYLVAAIFTFSIYDGNISVSEIVNQSWFIPSIALGFLFALSFLLYALSTQKAGMAITSVSSKMAILIPVLIGAYLHDSESLTIINIIALFLAMLSFALIFKKDSTEKVDSKIIILPILIFFFSGINDTLLKYIREVYFHISNSDLNSELFFLATLFSISFIISLFLFGIPLIVKKKKIEFKNVVAGFSLGILNSFSAFSMFKAMGYFESSVFFPVFNIGIVSLSAIIGVLVFKEKLTRINYIGLATAMGAILLLTI